MNKNLVLKVFCSLLAIFLITACGQNTDDQNINQQHEETTADDSVEKE